MNKKNIIIMIFVLLIISIIAWRIHSSETNQAPHYLILIDRSGSVVNIRGSVLGITDRVLKGKARPGSTLSILATGDNQSSSNEAVFLGSFKVPIAQRMLEGRSKINHERDEIMRQVSDLCSNLKTSNYSPIFLGVKRGIEWLRSLGCANGNCTLFIASDAEENQEKMITRSLHSKRLTIAKLPTINAHDIQILFCGISETDGRRTRRTRNALYVERLEQVWRSVLQTENLSFAPYCPKLKSSHQSDTME